MNALWLFILIGGPFQLKNSWHHILGDWKREVNWLSSIDAVLLRKNFLANNKMMNYVCEPNEFGRHKANNFTRVKKNQH